MIECLNINTTITASPLKTTHPQSSHRAFTLLEMFVVVSIVAISIIIILSMAKARVTDIRPNCTNNLKQVGLAFRMWNDDNGVYPMQYQADNFDGPRYASNQQMYVYFQAMSNELGTPWILACPGDAKRTPGTNFTTDFNNSKVSYFVGLDASETNATMFLAGDRNISHGTPPQNGILELTTNQPVTWTRSIHAGQGNILLADGSVQETTSQLLRETLQRTGVRTNRLALP